MPLITASYTLNKVPSGIMFHHFHGTHFNKSQGSISEDDLEKIIKSLSAYQIVSPEEWFFNHRNKKFKGNEICITFDDNLKCQYDIALPVLDRYSIKAFWFIYTSPFNGVLERLEVYRKFRHSCFDEMQEFYDEFFRVFKRDYKAEYQKFITESSIPRSYLIHCDYLSESDRKFRYLRDEVLGRTEYFKLMDGLMDDSGVEITEFSADLWMDVSNVQQLSSSGHYVGLHTHSHPTKLSGLEKAEQYSEFNENQKIIYQITNRKALAASFPNNSFSSTTLEVLSELGVEVNFCANPFGENTQHGIYPRYNHITIHNSLNGRS